MKIEVLGTGCSKCIKLAEQVKSAVEEFKEDIEIIKVTDIKQIMNYNVMITPALVVNGKLKISGRIPSVSEIKKWIEEEKI